MNQSRIVFAAGFALIAALSQADLTAKITIKTKGEPGGPGATVMMVGPQGSPFHVYQGTAGQDGVALIGLPGPGIYYLKTQGGGVTGIGDASLNVKVDRGIVESVVFLDSVRSNVLEASAYDAQTCEPIQGAIFRVALPGSLTKPKTASSTASGNARIDMSGAARISNVECSKPGYRTTSHSTGPWDPAKPVSLSSIFVLTKTGGTTVATTPAKNGNPKLDGFIRMANQSRIEVGKSTGVSVNFLYSGGTNPTSSCTSHITVKRPDGETIFDQTNTEQLNLNAYKERRVDIMPKWDGTYTVSVVATGENNSSWSKTYTFVASKSTSASQANKVLPGTYEGSLTFRETNGTMVTHLVSMTFTGSGLTMKGYMSPGANGSYHFTFAGRWNSATNKLEGTAVDIDKKYTVTINGTVQYDGKISLNVDIASSDKSLNRNVNFGLQKK